MELQASQPISDTTTLTVFTITALEMIRRFQWVFFHVENEWNKMNSMSNIQLSMTELSNEEDRLLGSNDHNNHWFRIGLGRRGALLRTMGAWKLELMICVRSAPVQWRGWIANSAGKESADHAPKEWGHGSRWRFTKMYHQESPARGRTYKASSPRLAFFSMRIERAETAPATQYTSSNLLIIQSISCFTCAHAKENSKESPCPQWLPQRVHDKDCLKGWMNLLSSAYIVECDIPYWGDIT
ncbi:EXS, C-terminal [Dillenia turbinata]|uniref:EXS, C-terminal n=1 Tax=Dillenia turbinata TaxID=194707 RepID=A0AAN8V415_9MAGN